MGNIPNIRFRGFTDEWEQCEAKELCQIGTGKSNTQDQNDEGNYPFFIRSDTAVKSNKYLYDCEAVITIGDGNIGRVFHYINGKFDLHQRCYKMTDFNDITGKYFYYFFGTKFYKRAMSMTAKATVDSVRLEMISEMPISYPESKAEQDKIATVLSTLDNLIICHQRKYEETATLKKYMLKKMFPTKNAKYPEIRFEEFSDEWEPRKLIEVCDYVDYRGKTPTKTDEGIFLITAKNIKDGYIDYESSKEYIAEEDYEEVMHRGVPKIGDVLITTEAPCGNVAQINIEDIALAQRIIKYRGKKEVIDNTFLKYYLLSPEFQAVLNAKASGGTVKGIKGSILHQQLVVFPSYKEQMKIGIYLEQISNLITLHQRKYNELKELKKYMLQNMFPQKG